MTPIELPELTTPEIILNVYLNGIRLEIKHSNIGDDQFERIVRQNGFELILTQLIKKYYPNLYCNQIKLHVVINRLYHEFISSNDYITESFIKSRVDEIINESITSESVGLLSRFQCRHESIKLFNIIIKEYIHASGNEKARYLDFIVNPSYADVKSCINELLAYSYFDDVKDFNLKKFYNDPLITDTNKFITNIVVKLIGGDTEIGGNRLINSTIIRHTLYDLIYSDKVTPMIERLSCIFNYYNIINHDTEWKMLIGRVSLICNSKMKLVKFLDNYILYLDKLVCNDSGLYSKQHHEEIKQIYGKMCDLYTKLTK